MLPKLLAVQFRYTVTSDPCRNTFHVVADEAIWGDVEFIDLPALAESFANEFADPWRDMIESTTPGTFDEVVVSQVPDPRVAGDPYSDGGFTVGQNGTWTVGGDFGPSELCLVASFKTNLVGRRYRGRLYMPPAVRAADYRGESVQLTGGEYTKYGAAVDALDGLVQGNDHPSELEGLDLVVYSRTARLANAENYWARVQTIRRSPKLHWLSRRTAGGR
jgi:hypothetical protein